MAEGDPDEPETPDNRLPLLDGSHTEQLMALCAQLAGEPDIETALRVALQSALLEERFRRIREQAQAIERGLRATLELSTIAGPPAAESAHVERFVAESIQAETGPEKPGPQTLSDFFQHVTLSVIEAQSKLDIESLRYARQLQGTPLAPLHFGIPNVHAEVKMGFNVEESSGLFIRLFGKPEDAANYGESTVSFDITASPPPPGSDFTSPIPSFLAVQNERDDVLNAANVPADQRGSAIVIAGAAKPEQVERGRPYIVLVPQNGALTLYRISRDKPGETRSFDVHDTDVKGILLELVKTIASWLESVTIQDAG